MTQHVSKALLSTPTALIVVLTIGSSAPSLSQRVSITVPEDIGESGLAERRERQLGTTSQFDVFYDFRFEDRVEASGIGFRHRIVDDGGRDYKPVHYDHGNGLAAADVDGDGLTDLYFLSQLGSNELWRNLGDGRFADITEQAGVGVGDRVSVSASFADIDNDGDQDLYVTTVRHGNLLFENDGKGRFRDISHASGLDYVGHSSSGLFFDYDGDGLLDLFLVNVGAYTSDDVGRGGYFVGIEQAFRAFLDPSRSEASILYRNLGAGRFRDVSSEVVLNDRGWSGDAVAFDFDGDGDQDLYVLNMHGNDRFYENVEGSLFVDRTERLFPRTPPGSMGVKVFDWNNDGLFDLFLTDMHADMVEEVGPEKEKLKARRPRSLPEGDAARFVFGNAFYENTGDGFREISDRNGTETYWPWGVSVDDLNADGWDDLFITGSMNFPFRYAINSVLLNNRGETYLDSEFLLGVEPRKGSLTVPWFDIDCATGAGAESLPAEPKEGWRTFDGEVGSAEDGPQGERHPYCRDFKDMVTVMGARGSRSSVIFDLDADGDLDIVTSEFGDRPQVLVSDLSERKAVHSLEIHLEGTASNRNGFGSRVEVFSGGGSQVKVHDGKSGYLSQSVLPLYFGLGDSASVDRIEVTWPSGVRQTFRPAATERRISLVEPAANEDR